MIEKMADDLIGQMTEAIIYLVYSFFKAKRG